MTLHLSTPAGARLSEVILVYDTWKSTVEKLESLKSKAASEKNPTTKKKLAVDLDQLKDDSRQTAKEVDSLLYSRV